MAKVAESLGLHNGELIMNIEENGNTGCASTMIALSQSWKRFLKSELIVITVFGGGYSSGAMLLMK
jgi:3-oxoacyl-[acyl-carrier-protein] synthase-3